MHSMVTNPDLPPSSTYAPERFHSPQARSGHGGNGGGPNVSRQSTGSQGANSAGPGHVTWHNNLPTNSATSTTTTTINASSPTAGANRAVLTTSVFALTHSKPLSVVYSPVLKSRPNGSQTGNPPPQKNFYMGSLPAAQHGSGGGGGGGGLGNTLNSPTSKAPLPTNNELARMQLNNSLMDDRNTLNGSPWRTAAVLSPDPIDVKHEAFKTLSLELESLLGNIKSELASGTSIEQHYIAAEIPKVGQGNKQQVL